ncbi:3D domain-containing protein [Brevibacillus choshinensis]|uniref:3D domain-containing protein n=1 Tax=Brevibacillus choshinensis TaxID=54911 RepID=UPI002E248A45|nr:3D domain-containing protein [Brevibacillus choshinensis]MED4586373.1 3D domain-containing protein [Brevibacillus choshinensis]MED4754298.1 3D domain-containing protein [Brevibacillus choshinensis]MED4782500.1 3D domain-containing protein [Brevibacillus choshinensis]
MKKQFITKSFVTMALGLCLAAISTPAFAASSTYQIKAGDTFYQISKQYNVPLESVLKANPGVDPQNLKLGQTIQLPVANQVKTTAGQTRSYSKMIKAVATAYTGSAEENGGWAGVDYFGNPLKVGTIAVDPDVIPLGSTVYITGYKHGSLPGNGMIAKATDIGGAIKDARVDIYVPGKDASGFGMQNVKIYVLK